MRPYLTTRQNRSLQGHPGILCARIFSLAVASSQLRDCLFLKDLSFLLCLLPGPYIHPGFRDRLSTGVFVFYVLFTLIYRVGTHHYICVETRRQLLGITSSSLVMWVWGTELRLSVLLASTFARRAISAALRQYFCLCL